MTTGVANIPSSVPGPKSGSSLKAAAPRSRPEDARSSTSPSAASSRATAGKTRRRAREYQRIAVRCGCWLEHEDATVFGTTVDLGRGGLFLRTALPMPTGLSVRVTLRLPGRETVVADGKIVRTVAVPGPGRSHTGDRPGLGVRFERLPDGEDSLCAFLFGSMREQQQEAAESGEVGPEFIASSLPSASAPTALVG